MTGRDAANYILINYYDDSPLVIYLDGKRMQVMDILQEPAHGELVILLDYTGKEQEQ